MWEWGLVLTLELRVQISLDVIVMDKMKELSRVVSTVTQVFGKYTPCFDVLLRECD